MKTLIALSALLFSLGASAQVQILSQVTIDGVSKPGHVAELKVDLVQNEIEISIYNDICGSFAPPTPGMMRCLAMPMLVSTLHVPIQKTEVSCGSEIYSGMRDDTRADGLRQEVTVFDHTARLCDDLVPGLFVVQATSYNPWTNTESSYYLVK